MTIRLQRHVLAASLLGCSLIAGSCGDKPSNKDFPDNVNEATNEHQAFLKGKWEKLAGALGISTNIQSQTQLGNVPSFMTSDDQSTYQTIRTEIATLHASDAYKTRCAEVTKVEEFNVSEAGGATALSSGLEPLAAKVYKMSYKLQKNSAGDAEDNTRTGILILPTGTSKVPLVAYAHGGDAGLSYKELVGAFDSLQANYIIVAPTYPGEALCKTGTDDAKKSCDEGGTEVAAVEGLTSRPFVNDVDELLGMYDCVVESYQGKVTGYNKVVAGSTFQGTLASKLKTIGGSSSFAALPQSIAVGSSRGGLVAQLAVAESGANISTFFTWQAESAGDPNPLGTKYGSAPSLFSCAASFAAPMGLTASQERVLLELAVRGTLSKTAYYGLPGVAQLSKDEDLTAYVSDTTDDATLLNKAKLAVLRRDAAVNSPFIMAGLRDWVNFDSSNPGSGNGGALLMAHGKYDRIIPWMDTQILENTHLSVYLQNKQDTARLTPGAEPIARIFEIAEDDTDNLAKYFENDSLKADYTGHLDEVFRASKSKEQTNFFINTDLETYAKTQTAPAYGLTPALSIAQWLTAGACNKALNTTVQ